MPPAKTIINTNAHNQDEKTLLDTRTDKQSEDNKKRQDISSKKEDKADKEDKEDKEDKDNHINDRYRTAISLQGLHYSNSTHKKLEPKNTRHTETIPNTTAHFYKSTSLEEGLDKITSVNGFNKTASLDYLNKTTILDYLDKTTIVENLKSSNVDTGPSEETAQKKHHFFENLSVGHENTSSKTGPIRKATSLLGLGLHSKERRSSVDNMSVKYRSFSDLSAKEMNKSKQHKLFISQRKKEHRPRGFNSAVPSRVMLNEDKKPALR